MVGILIRRRQFRILEQHCALIPIRRLQFRILHQHCAPAARCIRQFRILDQHCALVLIRRLRILLLLILYKFLVSERMFLIVFWLAWVGPHSGLLGTLFFFAFYAHCNPAARTFPRLLCRCVVPQDWASPNMAAEPCHHQHDHQHDNPQASISMILNTPSMRSCE